MLVQAEDRDGSHDARRRLWGERPGRCEVREASDRKGRNVRGHLSVAMFGLRRLPLLSGVVLLVRAAR